MAQVRYLYYNNDGEDRTDWWTRLTWFMITLGGMSIALGVGTLIQHAL